MTFDKLYQQLSERWERKLHVPFSDKRLKCKTKFNRCISKNDPIQNMWSVRNPIDLLFAESNNKLLSQYLFLSLNYYEYFSVIFTGIDFKSEQRRVLMHRIDKAHYKFPLFTILLLHFCLLLWFQSQDGDSKSSLWSLPILYLHLHWCESLKYTLETYPGMFFLNPRYYSIVECYQFWEKSTKTYRKLFYRARRYDRGLFVRWNLRRRR